MENFDKENATNFLKNAMSRRGFLGAAGAVAATGALAACGTGGSTPARPVAVVLRQHFQLTYQILKK